jgi:AraC-like DNA-binding protein
VTVTKGILNDRYEGELVMDINTVFCERRSYQAEPQCHHHAYAQLIMPVQGILAVTVERQVLETNQQTVIYIPPDAPHSFYADASNQFLVWDIPATYIQHYRMNCSLSQPLDNRWNAVRELLLAEVGPDRPASNQRLVDLFRYILGLLVQKPDSASLAYIHDHYHQPLSIEELAAVEHYNPTYYCEWFQKQYGLPPMAYIRNLRLEMARRLLKETDYNILQIAEQVGYRHHSTLTRLFQEYAGILPSEYRMQSRMQAKNCP